MKFAKAKEKWLQLIDCRSLVLASMSAWAGIASAQAVPEGSLQPPPGNGPSDKNESGAHSLTHQQAAIVITGSRIPRTNLTAASPVTVVTAQEVEFQGTTNIEELLNELPQVAPSQGAFLNNGATGTATVDLRDLGPPRTLVLINGRRLGPGDPTQSTPDLNIVPPTLLKRVELLTGGASSVYGSDAVAGVVNFILDTSFDGVRIDAQNSLFQHDNGTIGDLRSALDRSNFPYPSADRVDGRRSSMHAALGKILFDGKAHVVLFGGYQTQRGLTQNARDYSACTATVRPARNDFLLCNGALGSSPATFVDHFGDQFITGPDRTFEAGSSRFNFAPYNYYQRPDERYSGGAFADAELSPAIKPYLEFLFLDDRSVAQLAPSVSIGHAATINCDNALLSEQQRALVCFDGNFVGQEESFIDDDGNLVSVGSPTSFDDPVTGSIYYRANLEVQRRNIEGGPRRQELTHRTARVVGGVKGELARGFSYDANYIQTRSSFRSDDTHFLSAVRMRRALDVVADPDSGEAVCRAKLSGEDPGCVPWDVFSLGGVTQAAVDYIDASAHRRGSVKQQVAGINSTLDLSMWGVHAPWSAEGPSINAGAEYRRDRLNYVPDPLQFTGDLAGAGAPQLPARGRTEVKELFAETRLPIIQNGFIESLSLEAGYRKSWYSNSQSRVSTNAWKATADVSPVRGLRLRGSVQRAVRAPNIIELFTPAVDSDFGNDPCAGASPTATLEQCGHTGVTPAQYGHIAELPDDVALGYHAVQGGNPSLTPERSRTKSIGLVLEPAFAPGLSATVDWWDIQLKGAVAQAGADLTMQTCIETGDPFFCSLIHRDGKGSLWLTPQAYVDDRLINIAAFKVRGVDLGIDYQHRLGSLGRIGANFVGSYTSRWVIAPGGLVPSFDCAGLFGGDCAIPTPRWRHTARLTWTSRGGISLSAHWRYSARMKLTPITDYEPGPYTRQIRPQSFFDLTALARIGERYTLRLGVKNIFDRDPPLVPSGGEAACGVGCNGNTYPQWYDPLGRYVFAGVSVRLKPF